MILSVFALITILGAIPLIYALAGRVGFVDTPDGRKQHEVPVPPVGGMVIFTVFLLFSIFQGGVPWGVFASVALILLVGLVDDAWELNAKVKFFLHFVAAFILVLGGGAVLHTLGNLLGFGDIGLWFAAVPFSVACVVYIQNAMNMMDGVDGLAGGQSFLIFAWFYAAALSGGQGAVADHILLVTVCVAGFLLFNMRSPFLKRAKLFLGDAGSMALGLMIAFYAMTLSQGNHAVFAPVSVAWILALPIVDSFGLLAMRLKEGRAPFSPDRRHFHHHFIDAGFSPGATTVLILAYSSVLAAIGVFGVRWGIPVPVLGWGWIALWIGHTILTVKSESFKRLLSGFRERLQARGEGSPL